MERLLITTAFALAMSTTAAFAPPSGNCGGCAIPEPIITAPSQGNCPSANCAVPKPVKTEVAEPCGSRDCALPEPEQTQPA